MIKRVIAGFVALSLTVGVMTSCDRNNYENKGHEREISNSVSQPESEQSSNSNTETHINNEKVQILESISNFSGVLEGKATIEQDGKSEESDITLEKDSKGNVKVSVGNTNETTFTYINKGAHLYLINYKGYDYDLLSGIGSAKDYLLSLGLQRAVEDDILSVSNDGTKLKLNFNSSTLFSYFCSLMDDVNANYESIYEATKNDKSFMSLAKTILGDDYDLSMGLSQDAFKELTDVFGVMVSDLIVTDATDSTAITILIDDTTKKITFEIITNNIASQEIVRTIKGELNISDKKSTEIGIPEKFKKSKTKENIQPDSSEETSSVHSAMR